MLYLTDEPLPPPPPPPPLPSPPPPSPGTDVAVHYTDISTQHYIQYLPICQTRSDGNRARSKTQGGERGCHVVGIFRCSCISSYLLTRVRMPPAPPHHHHHPPLELHEVRVTGRLFAGWRRDTRNVLRSGHLSARLSCVRSGIRTGPQASQALSPQARVE